MLVAEALVMATAQGAAGISLREAGRRIGVSHAAAYQHFPSKGALIAAAATEGMWQLAAELERAETRPARTAEHRIRRIAAVYVEFALREPGAFRLMFAPEVAHKQTFPELRAASDAASGPLQRAVAAWRTDQPTPTPQRGPGQERELIVSLWAVVHGLAVLALDAQLDEGELRVEGARRPRSFGRLAARAVARLLAGASQR